MYSAAAFKFVMDKLGITARTSKADASMPDQNAARLQAAARPGLRSRVVDEEPNKPNYDMKFHPMDPVVRPNFKRTLDHLEKSALAKSEPVPARAKLEASGSTCDRSHHPTDDLVPQKGRKRCASISSAASSQRIIANSSDEDEPEFDNLFLKPVYADWHDLLSLDRRIYLLQRGAPLKGNALPLKWDKVVKILIDELYFTRIEYKNWGGLTCLKERYERVCLQMQRLYEAEKEAGNKKSWAIMYAESFRVFDLKPRLIGRREPKSNGSKSTRRSVLDSGKRGKKIIITTLTDQSLSIRTKSTEARNGKPDAESPPSVYHDALQVLPSKLAVLVEEENSLSEIDAIEPKNGTPPPPMDPSEVMMAAEGKNGGSDTQSTASGDEDTVSLDEDTARVLPPKRDQMRAALAVLARDALAGNAFKQSMIIDLQSLSALNNAVPESLTRQHPESIASSSGHSQAYNTGMELLQSLTEAPGNTALLSDTSYPVAPSATYALAEPAVDPQELILKRSPPDSSNSVKGATSPTVSSIDPIAILPKPVKFSYGKKRTRLSTTESWPFPIYEDPESQSTPTAKRRKVATTTTRVPVSPDKENAHAGESSPDLSSRQIRNQLRAAEERAYREDTANSIADVVMRSIEDNAVGITEIGRSISESVDISTYRHFP